jgi:hypothetical protein
MNKSTNIIYYPGGCYGTFIEWCCTHFSNLDNKIDIPFTDTGSSHNYIGKLLYPPEVFFKFVSSNSSDKIVRCHPALFNERSLEYYYNNTWYDSCTADLSYIQENFKNVLVVHPTVNTHLWVENNVFQKCIITDDDYERWYKSHGYDKKFFAGVLAVKIEDKIKIVLEQELGAEKFMLWGKESTEKLDMWELRELMSYYWFKRIKDFLTCWDQLALDFPGIRFIPMDSFKLDSVGTTVSYLEYLDVPVPPTELLDDIINQWSPKQIHMYKDEIVAKAIHSIIHEEHYDWSNQNFTLLDEAYIQKSLMDRGIQIKCFNVNKFPTNTKDFLSILE